MKRILFLVGYPSGQGGPTRFIPAEEKLLEAGLHSSLTLQNETIYNTLIITSVTTVDFASHEWKHSPAS